LRGFVLDASVASRFVLREEYSGEVEAVLADFREGEVELSAPSIVVSEVGSALRKACVRGLIGEEEAVDGFGAFLGLGIKLLDQGLDGCVSALRTAIEGRMSFYDAQYLVACRALGVPLLTADDDLLRRAGEAGLGVHIRDYRRVGRPAAS
jgi:predicted nucleic acid-binding protein